MNKLLMVAALAAGISTSSLAQAEIKLGFVTSLSGNGASIGIPYSKGLKAGIAYQAEVAGEKVTVIELDDGTDPSAATRNARKLVEEFDVDILIGTATSPSSTAIMAVAKELKVPMLAVSPVNMPEEDADKWGVSVVQPASLMSSVIADRMQRDGKTNVGFIGFSDSWGDLCYQGMVEAQNAGKIKLLSDERYARTDTSVTGQILKLISQKPDAIMLGSSSTQGALPPLELAKRGYKGGIYGLSPLVNADFVRVGGAAVQGVKVSVGPVAVAEQLPDDHPAKSMAMKFRDAYKTANGEESRDNFAPMTFDAWLIFLSSAERALKTAQPGTPEFHAALKDEIFKTKELQGSQSVYNFKPGSYYGVDERSLVVVRLENGVWTYEP